jgi:hypothetical protein
MNFKSLLHTIRFHLLRALWKSRGFAVELDPRDNSVTLSEPLFNHMKASAKPDEKAQVFVFKVKVNGLESFGFVLGSPDKEAPTQLCDIQYNERYGTVGFESLCPTVQRICYELALPVTFSTRLSVGVCRCGDGREYYLLFPQTIKL